MHKALKLIYQFSKWINKINSPSQHQVEKAFVHITNTLQTSPLKDRVWICGGVLLGFARDGEILKYDTDIDFHYWEISSEEVEFYLKKLCSNGQYTNYSNLRNNNGQVTQHSIMFSKVKIDFFEAKKKGGYIEWMCYTTAHWNRPSRQFLNRIPSPVLEEINFYSVPVLKPVDHDLYLRSLYGDWKTPQTDYTYYIDSNAIVSKEPWGNFR